MTFIELHDWHLVLFVWALMLGACAIVLAVVPAAVVWLLERRSISRAYRLATEQRARL